MGGACLPLQASFPGFGPGTHEFAGAAPQSWMAGPKPGQDGGGRRNLDRQGSSREVLLQDGREGLAGA